MLNVLTIYKYGTNSLLKVGNMVFHKKMTLHPKVQAYINNLESKGNQRTLSSHLNIFTQFVEEEYGTLDSTLGKISVENKKKNGINAYDILIAFKNHRLNKHLTKGVRKGRVNTAANFIEFILKISIDRRILKNLCHWGKYKDEGEKGILDRPTVIKILQACKKKPRLAAFLHLIAVVGGRPKEEICQLRIKDIVFDPVQPYVHFRKEITKTNTMREPFMTEELVQVMKEWLEYKFRERNRFELDPESNERSSKPTRDYIPKRDENDLLFSIHEKKHPNRSNSIYHVINRDFQQLMKSLGLEKRRDGDNRRLITLKTFRDFVYSEIEPFGHEFAEYHLGHSNSTYWNKTLKQKIEAWDEVKDVLTYLSVDVATEHEKMIQMEKELAKMKKIMRDNWLKDTKEVINELPPDETEGSAEYEKQVAQIEQVTQVTNKPTLEDARIIKLPRLQIQKPRRRKSKIK